MQTYPHLQTYSLHLGRFLLAVVLLLCFWSTATATHNRAGEITFRQIDPLTIELTITTYTKASSSAADRDSLEFFWGDGSSSFVPRTNGNGNGVNIGGDIQLNIYEGVHTFPGRGTFRMGFEDPNRVGGILNVNWPNSIDVRFFLSTTITLLDPQFDGTNNSAVLLQPPIDIACADRRFVHNPNAFDPDGDSLSYELVTPLGADGQEVPGYQLPNLVGAGPLNTISLNPRTGEFVWESPQLLGEYNIAIRINEWRNGRIISSITRDMQILVRACDNEPPTVTSEDELCIIAGSALTLDVEVDDPNENQLVILSGSGAPFLFADGQATLTPDSIYLQPKYTSTFTWQTTCNHISDRYYQIVLKAEDNGFGEASGLVDLHTTRIKVVGPPPENLASETENKAIRLSWDLPYDCEVTDNNFFQGFSIWRKRGTANGELDTCTTGLEKLGYSRIEFNTTDTLNGSYTYLDNTVENGITYCYRVQAEFAQISATGFPYNRVASMPSVEVCQQLARDIPLLTRVSIEETDSNTGAVDIHWVKPLADDLDTLLNPPPYRYELHYSADDGATFSIVNDFTVTTATFSESVDSTYLHTGINTVDIQPYYYLLFYSNDIEYGPSSTASSVFMNIVASDNRLDLTWEAFVPWSNSLYYIYRFDDTANMYTLLDSTIVQQYTDLDVANGEEYCYYIQSKGSYALPSLPADILNDSQEKCSIPTDNVAPCSPTLEVTNLCQLAGNDITESDNLFNTLDYTNPNATCPDMDAVGYYIYYAAVEGEELMLIDSVFDEDNRSYEDFPDTGLSGCYAVAAVDANRNISDLSNIVCVDNCPRYILPNTFTPNGDGSNELFVPRVNLFIASVDFTVYNEWGVKLWQTTDPELNWDGTVGGRELPEGVYYYTCRVFENRVTGVEELTEVLSGYINILR